jgi:hypothetical protein
MLPLLCRLRWEPSVGGSALRLSAEAWGRGVWKGDV